MQRWLALIIGTGIALSPLPAVADDKIKRKVEHDGDEKITEKYKDSSGKHHKVKTKIDRDGDKVKVKTKEKIRH